MRKASAETLQNLFPDEVPPPGARIPPNTRRVTIHYSFDMAQQVMLHIFPNSLFYSLHTYIGTLSIRPTSTQADLFPYPEKMCDIWCLLRGSATPSKNHLQFKQNTSYMWLNRSTTLLMKLPMQEKVATS